MIIGRVADATRCGAAPARHRRVLAFCALFCGYFARVGPVAAQPAAPAGEAVADCEAPRYVLLVAGPSALDGELFDAIRNELATELSDRGLAVCQSPGRERGPAATVWLSRVDGKHVLIDIDDRATDKRISRGVSIAALPVDGRALAVALAIDELLRASWAELILRDPAVDTAPASQPRTRPARRAPEQRLDAPENTGDAALEHGADSTHTGAADAWTMSAALLYQHAATRWNALGGAVRGQYEFAAPFRLGVGVRAYHADRVTDALGSIAATGIGSELSVGACLGRAVRLCSDARLTVDHLVFDGRGNRSRDIMTRDRTGVPVISELALNARWPAESPIFGALELSAGYALHGVNAASDARKLVGLSGHVLGASLSIGVRP